MDDLNADDFDASSFLAELCQPDYAKRQRIARWKHVYAEFKSGASLESIGKSTGCHVSVVKRLLRRAAVEEMKKPGFTWPKAPSGKPVCDYGHPMPKNADARSWHHASIVRRKVSCRPGYRLNPLLGICPVCRLGGLLEGGPLPI